MLIIYASFWDFGTFRFADYKNKGIPPFTIVQCNPNIDWNMLLQMICTICNDYEQWVIEQTLLLEEKLENIICIVLYILQHLFVLFENTIN